MANYNRKYPKTTGYWVYAHTTPNGLYYIGMSKQQPSRRWCKSMYKDNSLAPYIAEYGWENITHKVIIDGLTKEQAEAWEDKLIVALSMNGLCVNKQRSGGIKRDNKQAYMKQWEENHKKERKQYIEDRKEEMQAYHKQYREDHKEEKKVYQKQRRSTTEGKIYNRVTSYNQRHTPIETPAEAKRKYIETGYIPNYIKNDDLE